MPRPLRLAQLAHLAMLASFGLALATGCGGKDAESVREHPTTKKNALAGAETTRKQVYDLRPRDLERFPIWEHALDEEGEPGQDEATVKPRPDLQVADPREGLLLVRAEFVAHDGTRFYGYVYPSQDRRFGSMQPTIVTDDGQVSFWYGAFPPKPGALEAEYELLGKTPRELFPVKFHALEEYKGAKLDGEVRGFMHYRAVGSDEIVEVR